ncbi:chitinase A1-like [Dermatophagoides farinae]|uniref:chitinase A1-like n=1 Tax=Dermatophagoides farinae TaxID=6954 RepID=UPI003F602A8A
MYHLIRERYPTEQQIYFIPALGGWSLSHGFQKCLTSSEELAKKSLNGILTAIKHFNLDGIDFDWEYPGCAEKCGCQGEYTCKKMGINTGNVSGPDDWDKYFAFLKALRKELKALAPNMGKKHLYVSLAVGMNYDLLAGGTSKYPKPTPVEQICEGDEVDFANLMAYDFFGAWVGKTGSHALLYPNPDQPEEQKMNIHSAAKNILSRCSDPSKLNMGLATYARSWRKVPKGEGKIPGLYQTSTETIPGTQKLDEGWLPVTELDKFDIATDGEIGAVKTGSFPWFELVQNWFTNNSCERHWSPNHEAPILYCGQSTTTGSDTEVFISYEDPESWFYKTRYAKASGMGGVIIWAGGDMGSMIQNTAAGTDIGRPLWSSIFQGWFYDLTKVVGEAKYDTSFNIKNKQYPVIADLNDSACAELNKDDWGEPLCSCPINAEQRLFTKNPGETRKFTQMQPLCTSEGLFNDVQCPNCAQTGSGVTITKSTKEIKHSAPEACKRLEGLPAPTDLHDPLKSYTIDQMNKCESKKDDNDDKKHHCPEGCKWICRNTDKYII